MKYLVLAVLAIGAATVSTAPAQAAGGCGHGFHRGPHGRCIPNWRRGW